MKKILIILALLIAITSTVAGVVYLKQSTIHWEHELDVDSMTDQERHVLAIRGTTKYGAKDEFLFGCLDSSSATIIYDGGMRIRRTPTQLNQKSTSIKYRLGNEAFIETVWDFKNYKINSSDFSPRRDELTTSDENTVMSIMKTLYSGKTVRIQLGRDITELQADRVFMKNYPIAIKGCGLKNFLNN